MNHKRKKVNWISSKLKTSSLQKTSHKDLYLNAIVIYSLLLQTGNNTNVHPLVGKLWHIHNAILLSNKKGQTTETCKNINESPCKEAKHTCLV